jgi:CBS domain-containing protein
VRLDLMRRGGPWDDDLPMSTSIEKPPSLHVHFRDSSVRDAMTTGIMSCVAETPLRSVARLMASYRVHSVVVLTDSGWGVVSDLDLIAAAATGVDDRTARHAAGSPAVTIGADEPLVRAAQLMREHETSHLLVVDVETTRPVGVVSTLDVARAIASEPGREEWGATE